MADMTDDEIAEARRIIEAATPPPWECATVLPASETGDIRHPQSPWCVLNGPPQVIQEEMASKRAFTRKEDVTFCAAARTGWPRALDELQAERERCDCLAEEIEAMRRDGVAAEAARDEAVKHLRLIMPMARGYMVANQVGANVEIVRDANDFLVTQAKPEGEKP